MRHCDVLCLYLTDVTCFHIITGMAYSLSVLRNTKHRNQLKDTHNQKKKKKTPSLFITVELKNAISLYILTLEFEYFSVMCVLKSVCDGKGGWGICLDILRSISAI